MCVCLGRGHKESYTISNIALLSIDLKQLVPATLRCLPCILKFILSSWCILGPVCDASALLDCQPFRNHSEETVLGRCINLAKVSFMFRISNQVGS